MSQNPNKGKVMTVLGPVEPSTLGTTNPHEHLIIDFLTVGEEAQRSHQVAWKKREHMPGEWSDSLSLKNYYEARRNPFLFRDTLQLTDVGDATEALHDYKAAGGGCIVDVTPIGVGRNPKGLKEISTKSGVNVVMGTGYYVRDYQPADVADMDEDAICDRLLKNIEDGEDGVRPGIIGEIGLVWPVHDQERKVLRAAAKAQKASGLVLTIHPGRNTGAPMEAVRIVESAGGDPMRTIIDHLDRTIFEKSDFLELARTGCFLEQDLFGWETSYYPMADIDMPNDAIRVNNMLAVAEKGHLDQLLVSLDIDSRPRLAKYGGEGYEHIIRNIVPLMRRKGFSEADVDKVIRKNPQRALTIV
jgi:phosphotriesterase-related protein